MFLLDVSIETCLVAVVVVRETRVVVVVVVKLLVAVPRAELPVGLLIAATPLSGAQVAPRAAAQAGPVQFWWKLGGARP